MNILWLDQHECQSIQQVGGKAAQLSRLAAHYRVPLGFCLTVAAFADWPPGATMPTAVQAAVTAAYHQLTQRAGQPDLPVAVRSSAVNEDGAQASFAGQYATLLNVVGSAAVIEAITRCWQSAQATRVQSYQQQQGLPGTASGFAVLIQQMVAADVAAVAFSANPISGVREEIVINATWGLGESLVSGQVTPDNYTVRKSDRTILTRQVAAKTHMTVPLVSGVHTAVVPAAQQKQAALADQQVLTIAQLASDLEQHLGWPVDLECAYQADQLYLLQCRPITTALQPAVDNQRPTPTLLWDRPEDAQLTWVGGYDLVLPLRQSLVLYYYQGWAKAFRAVQAEGGLRARYVDGYEYRLWEYSATLPARQAQACQQALEEQLPTLWREQWLPAIQADLARWRQVDLAALSTDELACHLHEMLTRQLQHWEIHAHLGSVPLTVVQRLIDWYLARFPTAPESEPYRLLQGQANISIDGNYVLWTLSNQVTYPVADALRAGKWLELPADFQTAFASYLARFGDNTPATQQRAAQLILHYAEHAVPNPYDELRRLAQERERFTQEVRAGLTAKERKRFDRLLAAALLHNPLTEDHNLYLDQQSDAATRLVCAEFGRRLVAARILATPEEVDYLTLYELLQWGFGLRDPLRPRVATRQAEYARYRQLRPPTWLGRAPEAGNWVDRFSGPAMPLPAATDTVRGIGASAGIVCGPARVVATLEEALVLQQGEILVCPATDPRWTPLFALAAGLVTDRGGSLAHAAVLAREYSLPAVVGTHTATQRITSGQVIEIDGTQGVVRLR